MKIKDLKILIPTCNHYVHLIEGTLYTFKKFWPNHPDVVIVGYEEPQFELPQNCKFVSLGEQRGPKHFSTDLIEFFKTFTDEYFINFIDDTILTRTVDTNKLEKLFEILQSNDDLGKVFLTGSVVTAIKDSYFKTDLCDIEGIVEVKQDANYRTSIQASIWKKDIFLKYLKPNLSPWDFEMQWPKNDGVRILSSTHNHPMVFGHIYRKGNKLINNWYDSTSENTSLPQEDRIILEPIITKQI
jgi:hypothetical protein